MAPYYEDMLIDTNCPFCGKDHVKANFCPSVLNEIREDFRNRHWAWTATRNIQAIAGSFLIALLVGAYYLPPLALGLASLAAVVSFAISLGISMVLTEKAWEKQKHELYKKRASERLFPTK
ncbi:MAG: hypothetical protein WC878_02380 [Candidatus Paceibacterota bacterium]